VLVNNIFTIFNSSSGVCGGRGRGSTLSRASLKTGTRSSLRRDICSFMRFKSNSRIWIFESKRID
jgi:hypothetical protein